MWEFYIRVKCIFIYLLGFFLTQSQMYMCVIYLKTCPNFYIIFNIAVKINTIEDLILEQSDLPITQFFIPN